jgi:hypothetical protein
MYWLAALALLKTPEFELLPTQLPHLGTLLTARIIKADYEVTAEGMPKLFAGAPASWALLKRASRPVSNVQVTWELPIERLREAAQSSVAKQAAIAMFSPRSTPPLDGVHYKLKVTFKHTKGSSCVGMFASAQYLPAALVVPFKFAIKVPLAGTRILRTAQSLGPEDLGRGWDAFFAVPPMAGGWDEVAWAGKGLPTSGRLTIKLTVSR